MAFRLAAILSHPGGCNRRAGATHDYGPQHQCTCGFCFNETSPTIISVLRSPARRQDSRDRHQANAAGGRYSAQRSAKTLARLPGSQSGAGLFDGVAGRRMSGADRRAGRSLSWRRSRLGERSGRHRGAGQNPLSRSPGASARRCLAGRALAGVRVAFDRRLEDSEIARTDARCRNRNGSRRKERRRPPRGSLSRAMRSSNSKLNSPTSPALLSGLLSKGRRLRVVDQYHARNELPGQQSAFSPHA